MLFWRAVRECRVLTALMRRALAVTLLVLGVAVLLLMLVIQPEHSLIDRRWYLSQLSSSSQMTGGLSDVGSPLGGDDMPPLAGADGGGQCAPRRSIFFLKTHKCGSSTVQNILMRHGERHALDFVLPGRGNYIGSPEPFRASWVPEDLWPRSGRFDVFTHHTRLNVAETRRVMREDAVWVTILRDPVTQFESAYDYYSFGGAWGMTLKEFIALPLQEKRALPRVGGKFGANQMAFDLGYNPAIAAEPRLVAAMLRDLDQTFHLVMIMELMDESLVLLRRLMCWSTNDVTYLTKNARFDTRRTQLSGAERAALEDFLALDVTLYRHFRRRLAEQVAAVPLEAFLAQAEALVARRLFWRQRCVTDTVKGTQLRGNQREITDMVQGYQLSDSSDWMCSRLGMAELGYTDLVRDAQRERLAVWHRVYPLLGVNASVPITDDG